MEGRHDLKTCAEVLSHNIHFCADVSGAHFELAHACNATCKRCTETKEPEPHPYSCELFDLVDQDNEVLMANSINGQGCNSVMGPFAMIGYLYGKNRKTGASEHRAHSMMMSEQTGLDPVQPDYRRITAYSSGSQCSRSQGFCDASHDSDPLVPMHGTELLGLGSTIKGNFPDNGRKMYLGTILNCRSLFRHECVLDNAIGSYAGDPIACLSDVPSLTYGFHLYFVA
jgi:hypothetical protein